MDAVRRREQILNRLRERVSPLSAAALASELSVSRQVVVGDIALLRAGGERILATPRGYVLERVTEAELYTLACVHGVDKTEEELNIMVDNGCTVVDVIVEHAVYGQLTGTLEISSRYDVRQFMQRLSENGSQPLSTLTGGVHIHNLRCADDETFLRTKQALSDAGFIYEE